MLTVNKYFNQRFIAIFLIVLNAALIALYIFRPTVNVVLNPAKIISENRFAYICHLPTPNFLYDLKGDGMNAPYKSQLRFFENVKMLGPAHTIHEKIRETGMGAFSHWKKDIYFSSSDNTNPQTNGRRYSISVRANIRPIISMFCFIVNFIVGGYLLFCLALKKPAKRSFPAAVLLRGAEVIAWLWSWALRFSPIAALIMAIGYILTVIAGFIAGHALPPASIFYFFPQLKPWVHWEPGIPYLLLAWSIWGATWAWLARIPNSPLYKFAHDTEEFIFGLLAKWGWLFVLAIFTLQLGSLWSGVVRPDMHSMSIAGFVPFSDSGGYFSDIGIQIFSGKYSDLGSQRPIAAVFRTVIWFLSGGSFANFLMAQTWLLALVVWLAILDIARWRGIWVATCFLGFLSIMIRPFLSTFMTETSGLIFSVLSLIFIITSLRRGSLTYNVLGLAGLTLALFARMGALFMIPAFLVWTGWRFRFSRRVCLRALVLSFLTVLLCWIGTVTLLKLYGSTNQIQGGNFSYATAGLSLGGNWGDARDKYATELSAIKTTAEQSRFLYAKTVENIRANPGVIGRELLKREWSFLEIVLKQLFIGYGGYVKCPKWLFAWFMTVSIAGWFYVISKKREDSEFSFYIFLISSIIISAPFVIYDDGWRVLMVAYPVLWMALSSGLASPSYLSEKQDNKRLASKLHFPKLAAWIFFILCIGGLLVPALAYHFFRQENPSKRVLSLDENGAVLLRSGKNFAGMLVLLDGEPLLPYIPSIHYSDFITIIRDFTWFELCNPLITPIPPDAPFALIMAQASSEYLIAPVDILRRKDVPLWLIKTTPWPVDPPEPPKYRAWKKVVYLQPVNEDGTVGVPISLVAN